ncbi:MAG: preprotein translocase subunit YajC [Ruminococcaceae bacterium]|nr:preprotein translocase subunit YajC [Oscillospiraceae bacterium]
MGPLSSIIMMVAIFAIMYFMMIRPQRKKEKETREMIAALIVGDKVVTIGGICGKVVKIKDDYIYLETGNVGTPEDRSVIKMERSSIRSVEKKVQA